MAYTNLNFVPGEILTAAKMNLLAANDASFRDGTGIGDNTIQASKLNWSNFIGNNFQTGTVSATFYPSGNTSTKSVIFPKRFKNPPLFFAQHCSNAFGELYIVTVSSVSTTGATLRCRTNHNQSVNSQVMWCAIGETT